jgi:hypothetical protein
MAHYRKIIHENKQYEYVVGKNVTYIKGLGKYNNSEYGALYEYNDTFVITPKIVVRMIKGIKNTTPIYHCKRHNHKTNNLVYDEYILAAKERIELTPACPECNYEQYMNS